MKIEGAREAFAEMLRRAEEIEHKTVWARGNVTTNEVPGKWFLFFTANSETARKVEDALNAAGLLCDTDLGRWTFSAEARSQGEDPGLRRAEAEGALIQAA